MRKPSPPRTSAQYTAELRVVLRLERKGEHALGRSLAEVEEEVKQRLHAELNRLRADTEGISGNLMFPFNSVQDIKLNRLIYCIDQEELCSEIEEATTK